MNTPYRPLYLALLLASAPFPATTAASSRYEVTYEDDDNEEIIDTEASTPKKKAKSKKRTKDNLSKRAQQVFLAVFVGGVLIFAYQYHQGKKNDDGGGNNNDDEKKDDNKNNENENKSNNDDSDSSISNDDNQDDNKNNENKNDEKKDDSKNNINNDGSNENNNDNDDVDTNDDDFDILNNTYVNDTSKRQTYKQLLESNGATQDSFSGGLLLAQEVSGEGNAQTFLQLLQKETPKNTNNTWKSWIVQPNGKLLKALNHIFVAQQWSILKKDNDHANIEKLIYGMANGGRATPLEAGYAWAQILFFIQSATNANTMKEIIAHKNHRLLAKLVSLHKSNAQKVDRLNVNNTNTNMLPSILATCLIGGGDPTDIPTFGRGSFAKGKTIQTVARRKQGANNRLTFKQQNNQSWTVETLDANANNSNDDDSKKDQ